MGAGAWRADDAGASGNANDVSAERAGPANQSAAECAGKADQYRDAGRAGIADESSGDKCARGYECTGVAFKPVDECAGDAVGAVGEWGGGGYTELVRRCS